MFPDSDSDSRALDAGSRAKDLGFTKLDVCKPELQIRRVTPAT